MEANDTVRSREIKRELRMGLFWCRLKKLNHCK